MDVAATEMAAGEMGAAECTASSSPQDDMEFSATARHNQGIPPSENKPYKLALGVGSVKAAEGQGSGRPRCRC